MDAPLLTPDLDSLQCIKEIRRSEASSIFEGENHGKRYALKVVGTLVSKYSWNRTDIVLLWKWRPGLHREWS